jgi:general secretion pathway protein G
MYPTPKYLAAARQRQSGFTLLELLVVIVIIGLLAAYVGPMMFKQGDKAAVTVARNQIASFQKALDIFRLDIGRYPNSEEGLAALMVAPATGGDKWNGPYLSKPVPADPWGKPYSYRSPGASGDYEIVSTGKDGQAGGTGDAQDIVSQ